MGQNKGRKGGIGGTTDILSPFNFRVQFNSASWVHLDFYLQNHWHRSDAVLILEAYHWVRKEMFSYLEKTSEITPHSQDTCVQSGSTGISAMEKKVRSGTKV